MTASGLISARLQSLSRYTFARAVMIASACGRLLAGEAEIVGDAASLERLQAELRVDDGFEDFFRRAGGDFLDLDAALGAGHQHRQADGAVENHADVDLADDLGRRLDDQQFRDLLPLLAGLLGDERILEHDLGDVAGVVAVGDELDAADQSLPLSLKRPLPRPPAWIWALSTTGPPPSWSNACCASAAEEATMPRGIIAPAARQEFFRLIFVNLHAIILGWNTGGGGRALFRFCYRTAVAR